MQISVRFYWTLQALEFLRLPMGSYLPPTILDQNPNNVAAFPAVATLVIPTQQKYSTAKMQNPKRRRMIMNGAKPSEKPTEISYDLWKSLQMHLRFGIYELGFGFKGPDSGFQPPSPTKSPCTGSPRACVQRDISQHFCRGFRRYDHVWLPCANAKCMQMNGKTASKQNRRQNARMTRWRRRRKAKKKKHNKYKYITEKNVRKCQ